MKRDRKSEGPKPKPQRSDALGANAEIAKRLRDYYGGLVSQDVPGRFVDLLSKLEEADAERRRQLGADESDEGRDGRP